MKIERVPVSKINPAPYNPRIDLKPGMPEYEKLKKSIETFGFVEPLVWNQRSGNLVGGHQRLKILLAQGVQEVECSVVDLDDKKEKALNIALNKISGDWSVPTLKELLVSLDDGDFDLTLTGFDERELKDLIDWQSEGPDKEDDVPETPKNPITKTGDLWILGDHRLLCGDSTSETDVARLMDGRKADMVFTDPPYNIDYGVSKKPRHKIRTIENDKQSLEGWKDFCHLLFTNFKRFAQGDIYMWGAPGPEGMRMRLWLTEMGCHWSATIIWKKQQLVISSANYQRIYEPCFYGWFKKSSFVADRKQTEVWEFDKPHNSKLHPTMKPVELCEEGIRNSSLTGASVLDSFCGSGSTLIACEKLGRKCYGMEIDPTYCDVIIERWQGFTGKEAHRQNADGTTTLWSGLKRSVTV